MLLLQKAKAAINDISDVLTLAVNLLSIASLALAGAALNLALGRYYGFDGLGVFSQALLFYLLLGQVTAGGFAFNSLYYFSLQGPKAPQGRSFLISMCLPVLGVGVLVIVALMMGRGLIAQILHRPAMVDILPFVAVAVLLFGLNKVGTMALNGMGYTKIFAIMQGIRMPTMLLAFVVMVVQGAKIDSIGWVFIASETLLFLCIFPVLWGLMPAAPISVQRIITTLREEGGRGWRGAVIGLLADINSKLDIFVLSLFVPTAQVGVYALGGMFADGLRMVLAAVQNVVNPQLAGLLARENSSDFRAFALGIAKIGVVLAALVLAAGLIFMLTIAGPIMGGEDILTSTLVFGIIGMSSVIASQVIILNQSFMQAGRPGLQTGFFVIVASANLVLNFALIPPFGPLGAAVATAIAEVAQILVFWIAIRRVFRGRQATTPD